MIDDVEIGRQTDDRGVHMHVYMHIHNCVHDYLGEDREENSGSIYFRPSSCMRMPLRSFREAKKKRQTSEPPCSPKSHNS